MLKMIVSDVDGTLVPVGSSDLTAEIPALMKKLNEKGILTVLASGRGWPNLQALFPAWDKSNPLITSNGSCIVCQDRVIHADPVAWGPELRALLHILDSLGCEWAADRPAGSVSESVSASMAEVLHGFGTVVQVIPDVAASEDPVLKLSVYCPQGADRILHTPEFMKIREKYHAVSTCDIFVDITARTADKGSALKKIQELWKIRPEETAVLGDAMNDLGMLKAAGCRCVVRSAPQAVLDIATRTMDPPEESGVIAVLKDFLDEAGRFT